jgi:8-oxo-dGTP pyrophosphatase MutT (NUDIX family)
VKARAAVIILQSNKIALIERHRQGRHFFVFPGGKVEFEETPAEAAAREAEEELGLTVIIGPLVAEIWYLDTPQYYFLAQPTGGMFGNGSGPEMNRSPDSKKGAYLPVWMDINELLDQPIQPKFLGEYIRKSVHEGWPEIPKIVMGRRPTDDPDA